MTKRNPYYKFLTREQREHARAVEWLRYYPETRQIRWTHHPSEGKRTPFQTFLWSIMGSAKDVPDFMFFVRRKGFGGLALEFKSELDKDGNPTVIFNKNGTIRADKRGQWEFLLDLRAEGWKADFAVGFDDFMKKVIDYIE